MSCTGGPSGTDATTSDMVMGIELRIWGMCKRRPGWGWHAWLVARVRTSCLAGVRRRLWIFVARRYLYLILGGMSPSMYAVFHSTAAARASLLSRRRGRRSPGGLRRAIERPNGQRCSYWRQVRNSAGWGTWYVSDYVRTNGNAPLVSYVCLPLFLT